MFYVIFGIEDFAVYAIIWEIAFVAIVLRCAATDTEFGGKLSIGHEAFASE